MLGCKKTIASSHLLLGNFGGYSVDLIARLRLSNSVMEV